MSKSSLSKPEDISALEPFLSDGKLHAAVCTVDSPEAATVKNTVGEQGSRDAQQAMKQHLGNLFGLPIN